MAVTQDQLTTIQNALRALGISPGDETTLARDVNAGLVKLTALINENVKTDAGKITYDYNAGYTPEFGQLLSSKIDELKQNDDFERLRSAYALPFGESVVRVTLNGKPGIPAAMQEDPALFFGLVDSAQNVISALDAVKAQGDLKPIETQAGQSPPIPEPEEPVVLSMGDLTATVETALQQIVPQLNTALKDASDKTQAQVDQLPEGFMRDIAGMFIDFAGGGVLDKQILVGEEPDGVFDWRSQASLQGVLSVLGHPQLFNFQGNPALQGEPDWLYSQNKGQHILNILKDDEKRKALEKRLSSFMSADELAQIQAFLKVESVEPFIAALDQLDEAGLVTNLDLFDQSFEMPVVTQDIFQARINEYMGADAQSPPNPAMAKLLDALTRQYAGQEWGLYALGLEIGAGALDAPIAQTDTAGQEQQIAQAYKDALAQHKANGGSDEAFSQSLLMALNTVVTLPFGNGEYRQKFNGLVGTALEKALAQSDPDKAAEALSTEIVEALEGSETPYIRYQNRSVPVWMPGLEEKIATEFDGNFTAQQIAQLYDDFHFATLSMKDLPVDDIDYHAPLAFKDDSGQVWVAAINRQSMVFDIQKAEDALGGPFLEGIMPDLELYIASDRPHSFEELAAKYSRSAQAFRSANVKAAWDSVGASEKAEETEAAPPSEQKTSLQPEQRAHSHVGPLSPEERKAAEAQIREFRHFAVDRLASGPAVIMPDQTREIKMLQRYAGESLHLGTAPGGGMPILGIDMRTDGNGKMLVWYAPDTDMIKVAEASAALMSKDGRAALRQMDSPWKPFDQEKFKKDYPVVHEMVMDQQAKMRGSSVQHALKAVLDRVDRDLPLMRPVAEQAPRKLKAPAPKQEKTGSLLKRLFGGSAEKSNEPEQPEQISLQKDFADAHVASALREIQEAGQDITQPVGHVAAGPKDPQPDVDIARNPS